MGGLCVCFLTSSSLMDRNAKGSTVIVNQRMREGVVGSDRLKGMDLQTIDQRIEWVLSFFWSLTHTDRPTLMGVFGPEAKDTQSRPFKTIQANQR